MIKPILLVLLLSLFVQFTAPTTLAGDADWPQWRGPTRNGHSPAKQLLKKWPEEGPKLKWTFELQLPDRLSATSTEEMQGGAGKVVSFDALTGKFQGYGSPEESQ